MFHFETKEKYNEKLKGSVDNIFLKNVSDKKYMIFNILSFRIAYFKL